MAAELTRDSYGKTDVRVTKVTRHADGHELLEMSVDVVLEGAFKASYETGDNTGIVATDSMKNTIYVFARRHPVPSIEAFANDLSDHFIRTYGHVSASSVSVRQTAWNRIIVDGKPHAHSFVSGGSELRSCTSRRSRSGSSLGGGVSELLVLKTTDSAFKDFIRDEYTTLKDTDDRIFATKIAATWTYSDTSADFNGAFASIRAALLEVFATHKSLAVQQTLLEMGREALRRCDAISEISIRLPNKHRLLVNLAPFGLENKNEVFVWTDEPFGDIFGQVTRKS